MTSAAPRLYTTEQAAAELQVPAARISDWRHRGRVAPRDTIVGRGRGGVVPLYDLEDLRPLATAWHARKRNDTPSNQAP